LRSIPPEEFHIVGLNQPIYGHDWNPLDHGLGDDQAIKGIFVMVREFGNMERMVVLKR
jgi:hypothetical protein